MGFSVGGSLQLNTIRSESQIAKKIDSWYIQVNLTSSSSIMATSTAGDGINVFSRIGVIVYWTGYSNEYKFAVYGKDKSTDNFIEIYSLPNLYSGSVQIYNLSITPKRYIYCAVVSTGSNQISSGYIRGLVLP